MRRAYRVGLAGALLLCVATSAPAAQPAARGDTVRRTVHRLLDGGRLDEAARVARDAGAAGRVALGDVYRRLGSRARADSTYARAIAERAPHARAAAAARAELAWARGARDSALAMARTLVASYDAARWSGEDRVAAGRAYTLLAARDPQAARSALRAFDDAVAADSSNLEARLAAGTLLLSRYNAPDARRSFEDVLARDGANARAILGLAEVLRFDGDGQALAVARRAAVADPTLAAAQRLVARFHLDAERFDSAAARLDAALALDGSDTEALGLRGALAWVRGDSAAFAAAQARAAALSRRPLDFWTSLADAAVAQRRYDEAEAFAARAVALDPDDAGARALLGTTRLRTGDIAAGRADLERAFAADPFNVRVKNSLDLLDDLTGYRTVHGAHVDVVAPADQADLLGPYLTALLDEAYDTLARRYGWEPERRVRIELFPRHADFSVRSVGLTGLGALGVSFGTVLAMDAPSARERGEFNWGTVAWHELAHTFTLGRSAHRVPRWLSEGLSVFEERRARPAWGGDVSLPFLAAYAADGVRPVSRLSDGFIHPRTPLEVQHSYLMASLACEWMAETFGDTIFAPLLDAYRDGLDTPAAFTRVLGMPADSVDARVHRWILARHATEYAALAPGDAPGAVAGPFVDAMRAGTTALARGDTTTARAQFTRARVLVPTYPGRDGPAWPLARIALARGDTAAALRGLADITARDDAAWDANRLEAELRDAVGDTAGALAAWERLVWIDPREPVVHERLAALAAARGDHPLAVRERRAAVALASQDAVDPRFALAEALAAAGDRAGAYEAVLAVLERAPTYEPALDLFVRLREAR